MAKQSQINSITELYDNTNEQFKEIILKYILAELKKKNIIPELS